jgi:tRNA(Arg) A34 adenosine deaminase TadA
MFSFYLRHFISSLAISFLSEANKYHSAFTISISSRRCNFIAGGIFYSYLTPLSFTPITMEAPREEFMREAIRLSIEKMQAGHGGPFGAVIVKDGQIIARGFNQVTSTNDPTCHAEVDAIRKACAALGTFQLQDCDLYTSCEPCPMCLGAIYWSRPRRVFYGNTKQDAASVGFDDQFIYNEIEKPLSERQIPMQEFLGDEAKEGFKAWTAHEARTEY